MRLAAWGLLVCLAMAGAVTLATPAWAQAGTSGPVVRVDRSQAAPGEDVRVTLEGFAARSVTLTVCGNQARRGSTDCDMTGSTSRGIRPDGTAIAVLRITSPPVPCPCIIRASSMGNDQVAVIPIDVVGHPVSPVVGGPSFEQAMALSVTANPASEGAVGALRSSLGGATWYEVRVQVTNRSTTPVGDLRLTGSAGRDGSSQLVELDLSDPGDLAPGQTWEEVVRARLPAFAHGDVVWSATLFGSGPSITASETTSTMPLALFLLGAVFVADVLLILVRTIRRRGHRGSADPVAEVPAHEDRVLDTV